MRKILLCLLLVFPLTGPMTGPTYSGEKEFGPPNMHNGCRMGINEGYREALSKKKPSEKLTHHPHFNPSSFFSCDWR